MTREFISIGPITIYYYSLTMLLAVLTGIALAIKEGKKQNVKPYIEDLVSSLIIFGIIGARLYYVIFNFDLYKDNILILVDLL